MRKILFASLLLAGCSSTPLSSHKIDIQQGNFVNQEMIAKLQPGMTKPQVRFVLGTPLVADPFHADRWDYVYRFQKGGELVEQRHITAIFEDDKLKKVEGDVVPSSGLAAEAAGSSARRAERDPLRGAGPRVAGDVGDTKAVAPKSRTEIKSTRAEASEAKPKKAEEPEKKGLTDRFLGLFGFGGDEAGAATPPKPTVERSRGSPVNSQAVAAAATRPAETRTGSADAKSAEPRSAEIKSAPPKNAAEIAGIQEDGALRNREGKTIAEQLGDKLGLADDDTDTAAAPAGEKPTEAKSRGFEFRNREGKTVTQQLKEKFGFGDGEEKAVEEVEAVETVTTGDKPAVTPRAKSDDAKPNNAKTENVKSDKDGWFTFRNREGKTITEQVKDLFGPPESPESKAAQPAKSAEPAPSSKGSSRGTISADDPQPATGSGKSLGQKILDIFGFD